MLSFYDAASIAAAPTRVRDPRLQQLLTEAVRSWSSAGLLTMTHLLIIEPGDTEEAIRREVGFSPLVDPLDGRRFGSPAFTPFWDHLRRHDGWFELTVCAGNSGFAFILFLPDDERLDPELLALCRTY